ncbi:hypothetical protein JYP51_09395 [Ponticoccus gilvus]|nr:hypothetical protein [Enemella evansiae]
MTEMRSRLVVEADASAIVRETKRTSESLDEISREAEKTATALRKIEEQGRGATAMQQRLNETFSDFGANSRSAQASAAAFQEAFKARDAYRALEESIDPLIRAERELAAAQEVVDRAIAKGATTKAEAARQLQTLYDRYEAVVSAQTRVAAGPATGSARESAAVFEQAFRAREAYRALEESINPLIRAERELASAQKVVNQAVAAGVTSQEEAARQLLVLQGRYDAVAAAQARGARGARGGMIQGGVQNAAFQAQDIAVQLQMGTAASIVMAQQLPQLLGGFGMLGAVMGAVVAVGVPLASMWLANGEATGTLDESLSRLDASLKGVSDKLKLLRDNDLEMTFGSMAGDIRGMTGALLELERVAEQRALRASLDQMIEDSIGPGNFQRGVSRVTSLMAPGLSEQRANEQVSSDNYGAMTRGLGPSFEEFQAWRKEIDRLAASGDVAAVTAEVDALVEAFSGDSSASALREDFVQLLLRIGQVARETAKLEAELNGSALAERQNKAISEIVSGYEQQAALAAVIGKHEEGSAEAVAVRNRLAREALVIRLQQLDVEEDSERARTALAALDAAQAAEAGRVAQDRARSIAETVTGLNHELGIARAIVDHGQDAVEVERLRAEQAAETLRLRLEDLGATDDQIARAVELLNLTRQAERENVRNRAERDARHSLQAMQYEEEIQAAILTHGRESLIVKRLQIDAAREAYAVSLAEKQISEETRDALMAQWEAVNGLASADPFGSMAAAKGILDAQAQSIAQLRLEQALIGQSEETRSRVLALYQAELEIRRQGIDANSALAGQIRQGAREQADLAAEVGRQADAWNKVQRAGESAIDGMIDAALEADLPGVFEAMAEEITGILNELAIRNPLKNALLGGDLPTLDDAGGLQGIWARLTGQVPAIDPAAAAAQAAAQSVASMQVTAANVMISGAGVAQFSAGAFGGAFGVPGAANVNGARTPGGPGTFFSQPIDDWLHYANQGAIRSKPISDRLQQAMSFLGEMGISMEVFSGGQAAIGSGGPRTGSTRHDHGDAADVFFSRSGQRLDWRNAGDIPVLQEIVARARLNGLTGFGAGPGYMQPGSMHIGFGSPAVWGAGGSGGNAPDWLRQAWASPDQFVQPMQKAARSVTALSDASGAAAGDLGTLGTGFDAFGQMLSGLGTGSGSGGGGGGLLWQIASGIAGSMGIPGFSSGGWTGGSDPSRVAGLVHEEEYVFDAASTARIGVANLEAIRNGRMPGYASGGYVSPAAGYSFLTEGREQANQSPERFGEVPVIINDYAGVQKQVEYQPDGRGGRQMLITLGEQMAAASSQPGNPMSKLMAQRGAGKKAIRR